MWIEFSFTIIFVIFVGCLIYLVYKTINWYKYEKEMTIAYSELIELYSNDAYLSKKIFKNGHLNGVI